MLFRSQLYLLPQGTGPADTSGLNVTLNGTAAAAWTVDPATGLASSTVPLSGPALGTWTLATTSGRFDPTKIADVLMLVRCKTA